MSHDHEEADTLLILHAIDVGKRNPFNQCIIHSPDTDVFLILLHYCNQLPNITLFRTGKGDTLRDISVQECFEKLGPNKVRAILGFHTFTGCDQTGKFNTKSKLTCWKVFEKADESILNAFASLGSEENLPTLEVLEHLERFVCMLYGCKKQSNIDSLPDLRWHMFSKCQSEIEKLPPTQSALKYKIFRGHYCSIVLKRSHQAIQNLPSPENYGWEISEELLKPILTDNLPAPEAIIELSFCGCQTKCSTNRCKCYKHQLNCTDMCKCNNCDNTGDNLDITNNVNDDDYEEYDYEEYDNGDEEDA